MKKLLEKLSLFPNKTDLKSWLISYLIINAAFLFHTLNFMWGNHDVSFIKDRLFLSSGLFEGRATQFIPYVLLTDGQILPLLNNLIGFAFLTLGLWILAKYWELPKSILNYTLFIIFFATEPYTLSWLYFTFITISCLLWVFFAALGLYLSEKVENSRHRILLSATAVLCFYLPFGGYPPIINTIFVCWAAKLALECLFNQTSLKKLFRKYKFTAVNILIAAILFKLTLKLINPDAVYNLETTPLSELPLKLISIIKISFSQFFITVPFMGRGYKLLLAAMSLSAVIGAWIEAPNIKTKATTMFFIIGAILATALTTLLVVPHTEYVSRIDFYGYAFLYAFFLNLLLSLKTKLLQSLGLGFMILLIPLNIINDTHALRVWKLGWNAEFEILDRITERIENHPDYSPNKTYRFYPVGDISLRPMYYHGTHDVDDVFMLSLPYLAMWQAHNLLEFYAPKPYIDRSLPLLPTDITPEVYDFFMYKAAPFPNINSVYLNQDILIVVYNNTGLEEFKEKLHELYPQNKKQ